MYVLKSDEMYSCMGCLKNTLSQDYNNVPNIKKTLTILTRRMPAAIYGLTIATILSNVMGATGLPLNAKLYMSLKNIQAEVLKHWYEKM